ncbi:MAG: Gfo/Idh/MocA family oxidoreductase [Planctomycetes bacterium]|nr:Gfo/Idh/MocA family oxidoreductase [Planctomycetota bacterium]
MPGTIRLGVIGINPRNMGSTMTLLRDVPDLRYEIRAVCARRGDVLENFAREIQCPFWTTDYRQLVTRKDVDAVAVYSPDHLHAEMCLAALDAGKHVICTKPMCTRIQDAEAIVRKVQGTGLKFLVGQTMRFDLEFTAAKRFVGDGDLGEIIAAEAHYVHDIRPVFKFTPWRLHAPQDFMFGGVVHPADIVRCFMGEVAEVHAYGLKGNLTPEYPLMDNFFLNLKFASGKMGRVMGLYGTCHIPMPMMQVGLYGTKGSLVADFTDNKGGTLKVHLEKTGVEEPMVIRYPAEVDRSAYGHGATVIRYMRHFQECLDSDLDPSPSALDGARSVAIGDAAWQSIQSGQPVKVRTEF